MPIFVYRCKNCRNEVELLQKSSDAPLVKCDKCGQDTMHKVIAPVGIIFKGSGFYVTDNAHGSSEPAHNHHNNEGASSPESTEAAKTASEPASAKKAPEATSASAGSNPTNSEKSSHKSESGSKVA